MPSINTRLLAAASLVLAAFLGLTGGVLDRAFRDAAETALRERLQTHVYALLAAADLTANNELRLPDALPELRFSTPGSGLYAQVRRADNHPVWHSPSAIGLDIAWPAVTDAGKPHFTTLALAERGTLVQVLSFGVVWELTPTTTAQYTFSVAEDLAGMSAQLQGFRRSLWGGLGGVAVLLLIAQGVILRWSLAPLRRVAADLTEIETGHQAQLSGRYPRELCGLTDSLNALIRHERTHLERYRNSLADLAHSLKTPLAVLRGITESKNPESAESQRTLQDQVQRMDQIVHYQLHRAAAMGRTALAAPVDVLNIVTRLRASLDKVYADKNVTCTIRADDGLVFHGDESDLLEVLGNILDNAYKYCRRTVRVTANATANDKPGLILEIEDDGPGIPVEMAQSVMQRGTRLDTTTPGQGIGLAVAHDIVRLYHGTLEIGQSELGGAKITLYLPAGETGVTPA